MKEKTVLAVLFVLTVLSSRGVASDLECYGNSFRIVVSYSRQSAVTNALLYKAQFQPGDFRLIAQYQVFPVSSVYDLQAKGFQLYISQDPQSPTGWFGQYNAEVVSEPASYYGKIPCKFAPSTQPSCGLPPPMCHGMQTQNCMNGKWHCVGGGH